MKAMACTLVVSLLAVSVTSLRAETVTIELEPSVAGSLVPVQQSLSVGEDIRLEEAKAWAEGGVVLQPGEIYAQAVLTGLDDKSQSLNLYWIEPSLEVGQRKTYEVELASSSPAKNFLWRDVEDGLHRDLYFGEQAVLRHAFLKYDPEDHFHTCKQFHHLYGFHGEGLITNGPGSIPDYKQAKYPHHRGLYLGWSKTKTKNGQFDWWHCRNVSIRHQRFDPQLGKNFAGPLAAGSVSHASWCDPEGKELVKEKRELTVWRAPDGVLILDFGFTVETPDDGGDLELNGDPQHAGFQFRPHNDVAKSGATYFRPKAASGGKGDVWKDCKWIANQFTVKGHEYVVVHMDAPDNPGTREGETVYSTRGYGRFGAFAKHQVKDDSAWVASYRVMVLDAKEHPKLSAEHYESMYQQWVQRPRVKIASN